MNNPTSRPPSTRPRYDVFNGDADGICALHQLRLAYPNDAQLITGVKRDIDLLRQVPCNGKMDVTALDISLDINVESLRRILDAGGRVTYFDHHSARHAFPHPLLSLYWDDAPYVCTSILVDHHLNGRFSQWAAVAAFGDNIPGVGRALASSTGLSDSDTTALEKLGLKLNYNAYGEKIEDLHVAPDVLYQELHQYLDPMDFIKVSPYYQILADGYRSDAERMENLRPEWISLAGAIYVLPNEPWARRISGVFANKLIASENHCSFAVLTANNDGTYVVSVRSAEPVVRAANDLCERFSSGGGRKAAAGISRLPANDVESFVKSFDEYFSGRRMPAFANH